MDSVASFRCRRTRSMKATVHLLGREQIVYVTEKSDSLHRVHVRSREALDVIELEPSRLAAPAPSPTNSQHPWARSYTARLIASGMLRDHDVDSAGAAGFCGFLPTANRSFFRFTIRASSALSNTTARAPLGVRWRRRPCA